VGFERTIPGSERAKTVHALDRAATVTGEGYIRHVIDYESVKMSMFDRVARVVPKEMCNIRFSMLRQHNDAIVYPPYVFF
jgi:hypothetical protein